MRFQQVANSLASSCHPIWDAICAALDDAALVSVAKCGSTSAVVSAFKEMGNRHIFEHLQCLSRERVIGCRKFEYICGTGCEWAVRQVIAYGCDAWNAGLKGACAQGRTRIAEMMLSRGASNISAALYVACKERQTEIIELLVNRGCRHFDVGLYGACCGGHEAIARDMIARGATNFNGGLQEACVERQDDLVQLMISMGASECGNEFCPQHVYNT